MHMFFHGPEKTGLLRFSSRYLIPAVLVLLFFAAGCSSDDDSAPSAPSGGSAKTGRFFDSWVQGLYYISGNQKGVTDAGGGFRYEEGKNIIFKIGDIVLGEGVTPRPVMSPVDLFSGARSHTDGEVLNLCRFLQLLDDNYDPEDGIRIPQEIHANAKGLVLDFTLEKEAFETAARGVIDAIYPAPEPMLVPEADAQAHLVESIRSMAKTQRDAWGVWRIEGRQYLYSLFEAMGYAVALDRLFQAELFRRAALGKLSEIFGEKTKNADIFMRITGYSPQELEAGFSVMDTESKTILRAYSAGINRRIEEIAQNTDLLPYSFYALDFFPEHFSPTDILAITVYVMRCADPQGLGPGLEQIKNAAIYRELVSAHPEDAEDMFEDLRWKKAADATCIASAVEVEEPDPDTDAGDTGELPPELSLYYDFASMYAQMRAFHEDVFAGLKETGAYISFEGIAWAVRGTRTATGNPMLYGGIKAGFSAPVPVVEGTIQAGDITVSGVTIAGVPGFLAGRNPAYAWSVQTGDGHTGDYYADAGIGVVLDRVETIAVKDGESFEMPVYRTYHGPVVYPVPYDPETYDPDLPVISFKYSHTGYEFGLAKALLNLARGRNLPEFEAALKEIPASLHVFYADRNDNIAYFRTGRIPVRQEGEYRLPQGFYFGVKPLEWDRTDILPMIREINPRKGVLFGWNNKSRPDQDYFPFSFGPFHRVHVLADFFAHSQDPLTFSGMKTLALKASMTDSFGGGGNPFAFVSHEFIRAAEETGLTTERRFFLDLLEQWDGYLTDGGEEAWIASKHRSDAWIAMDAWIREVLRLTFRDEFSAETYDLLDKQLLFNVLIRGISGRSSPVQNRYYWFFNKSDETAPQSPEQIIVRALDNVIAELGKELPWGDKKRGYLWFRHPVLAGSLLDPVHTTPYASRPCYAQCVEMGTQGPVRAESHFALGASGNIYVGPGGTPVFDEAFFGMTEVFDSYSYRMSGLFQ